jgi:hypothetical protein
MPSAAHERLVFAIIERYYDAKRHLSPAVAQQVSIVGGQKINAFRGSYQSSRKEADVLFKYEPPNGPISYTCAVEIGFVEKYEDLIEDVKLWIEGKRMRMVILISVEENPRYRCPTHGLQDEEIKGLGLPDILDINTSMVTLQDPNDRFGPLQIHGLTWVNKMNAFLEIWKPDRITGEAKQHGDRQVSYHSLEYTI